MLITILGLLNGGYMLLDGIYVMMKGKYIGPPKPGPWSALFDKLNVDVFKLGPLFIAFGLLWLVWLYSLWSNQSWAYFFRYKSFDALVSTRWNNFFNNHLAGFNI